MFYVENVINVYCSSEVRKTNNSDSKRISMSPLHSMTLKQTRALVCELYLSNLDVILYVNIKLAWSKRCLSAVIGFLPVKLR